MGNFESTGHRKSTSCVMWGALGHGCVQGAIVVIIQIRREIGTSVEVPPNKVGVIGNHRIAEGVEPDVADF